MPVLHWAWRLVITWTLFHNTLGINYHNVLFFWAHCHFKCSCFIYQRQCSLNITATSSLCLPNISMPIYPIRRINQKHLIFKFTAFIMPPLAVLFDYMLMSPSFGVINCVVGEMSSEQTSGINRLAGRGKRGSWCLIHKPASPGFY